jgi:hypothetical protein
MLESAEKCQFSFELMKELDGHCVSTLWDGKKGLGLPNYEDWARIKIFHKFLRLFYEAIMRFSGSLYVTCNMYIQEVYGIQLHLQEYSDSDNYVLSSMPGKMMSKYNKYWGDLDKVNVLLLYLIHNPSWGHWNIGSKMFLVLSNVLI